MKSVALSFRSGLPITGQISAIEKIKQLSGVVNVTRLKPDSKNERVRRMGTVYLDDETNAAEAVQQLRRLPEVESASIPAVRELV